MRPLCDWGLGAGVYVEPGWMPSECVIDYLAILDYLPCFVAALSIKVIVSDIDKIDRKKFTYYRIARSTLQGVVASLG